MIRTEMKQIAFFALFLFNHYGGHIDYAFNRTVEA